MSKKRRVNWAFGNPAFTAWEVETAAGLLVVRRNHALVRAGERWRQGWDVWLGEYFAGALSSHTLSDLATPARGELLAVLRPTCCGRRREFQDDQPVPRQNSDFLQTLDFPLRSRYCQYYDPCVTDLHLFTSFNNQTSS